MRPGDRLDFGRVALELRPGADLTCLVAGIVTYVGESHDEISSNSCLPLRSRVFVLIEL